jgi:hypothetical protein
MATTVNFNVIQGDTFILNATYKDPAGAVIDLTDYSITFQVRSDFGSDIICATATKGDGITINSTTKFVTITMTSEQTSRFTVPKAAYQLRIESIGGEKTTLASGYFAVEKAVIV